MTFINRYTKQDSHNYYYAAELMERGNSLVFSIGQEKGKGLVTCTTTDGDFVWEKLYQLGEDKVVFHKIIQVEHKELVDSFYVIYAKGEIAHYLIAISGVRNAGEVVWKHKLDIAYKSKVFIEPSFEKPNEFFLIRSDDAPEKAANPTVSRFNYNGTSSATEAFEIPLVINDVKSYETGIAVGGYILEKEPSGILLDLDYEFGIKKQHHIKSPDTIIQSIRYSSQGHVVSCYTNKTSRVYVSLITNTGSIVTHEFGNTQSQNSQVELHENGFYLLHYTSSHGVLHKLNWQLNLQWSKELKFDKEGNGMQFLNFNPATHRLLTTAFNPKIESLVVSTYGNFVSCATQLLQPPSITILKCNVQDASINKKQSDFKLVEANVNVITPTSEIKKICKEENGSVVFTGDNTSLQSPNFYIQSAGSTGNDSCKGIHLRWIFGGLLGENHLPKGNYSKNQNNFNRPSGDFVKVFRTSYQKIQFTLDLSTSPSNVIDGQQLWMYKYNNGTRTIYVYFRNSDQYNQVRATINPLEDPDGFIANYGNELIEIENKRELFFAAELELNNIISTSSLQLEGLSVSENKVFIPKGLSFRKSFNSNELSFIRFLCENGRSIRLKTSNCSINKIHFEYYSDFITEISNSVNWQLMGDYALTIQDNLAFSRLDPNSNNPVHGKWLRFNDEAYVNKESYIKKWNGETEYNWQRNIKNTVGRYIELSESLDNPRANEVLEINFSLESDNITIEPGEPDEGNTQISNLDLLRMSSYDYHVARMLGLGTLDLSTTVMNGEFIYLAQYYSYGNWNDGLGKREIHHLSMSLPTSLEKERLPIPLEIESVEPGYPDNPEGESYGFTDEDGYSLDGKTRFVSIYSQQLPEENYNPSFYESTEDFDASSFTLPIYGGLEHRLNSENIWRKPELSHNVKFLNIDTAANSFETVFLMLPTENSALYIHKQTESGEYHYATYGINWFSRATSGAGILSITTRLKPTNLLQPPSDINAHLIVEESPLMFTSQQDQERLSILQQNMSEGDDGTLIRLIFDFDSRQDLITHQIPIGSIIPDQIYISDTNSLFPDEDEVFADEIEIHFRNKTPRIISAKIIQIVPHSTEITLCIFKTVDYEQASTGTTDENGDFIPEVLQADFPEGTSAENFIGSVLLMGSKQYVVHSIESTNDGLNFTVYKIPVSQGLLGGNTNLNAQDLELPSILGDGLFVVTENMQEENNWEASTNPHNLLVKIGDNWDVHREMIYTLTDDGTLYKYIEKSRGIWGNANIERIKEDYKAYDNDGNIVTDGSGQDIVYNAHRGLYKITFSSTQLPLKNVLEGGQFNEKDDSVEWYNGTVRLFTENTYNNGEPRESRKLFKVFRTENIGTTNNLVLYFNDPNFPIDGNNHPTSSDEFDEVLVGNRNVNYYPGYKVYLYENANHNLTEDIILPEEGEGNRYSIFGLRVVDNDTLDTIGKPYKSPFSVPAVMYAQELIAAQIPRQPQGALYATRPDYFGKATYTFTTEYEHKPYGVMFCRADNQAFLGALYEASIKPGEELSTLQKIKYELELLGGNDEIWLTDRWENFLNFSQLETEVSYTAYPLNEEGNYAFPLPDRKRFFEGINRFIEQHNIFFNENISLIAEDDYGTLPLNHIIISSSSQHGELKLIDFVRDAIYNTFVPLTEIPILYNEIDNLDPRNKKQNIRDKNGYLLTPEDDDFLMAPMVKTIGNYKTYYTDFTLDGTSNNLYFYGVREVGSLMKMSDFSPFIGPVKLVNSNPPEPPKIKSMLPVLENRVLGITPKIEIQVNAYPKVQNIRKLNLYRASNRLDAESILSMQHIRTVDVETSESQDENIWKIYDDFSDLEEVPYGDAFYYRVTVSRKVEYAKTNYNPDYDNPTFEVVTEYAPSLPSKIGATLLTEVYNPSSPILNYTSNELTPGDSILTGVYLKWEKTCYKGKYHVYKMNNQGTWRQIARLESDKEEVGLYHMFRQEPNQSNDTETTSSWVEVGTVEQTPSPDFEIVLPLDLTDIDSLNLNILDDFGNPMYHHFKVVAENSSGMLSTEERILTLPERLPVVVEPSYKLVYTGDVASTLITQVDNSNNPLTKFIVPILFYDLSIYHGIIGTYNKVSDCARLYFDYRTRNIFFQFKNPTGVTAKKHLVLGSVQTNLLYEIEMRYDEQNQKLIFTVNGVNESIVDNVIPSRDFGAQEDPIVVFHRVNGEIHPFMINGEEFNLLEGEGTQTIGSEGSIFNILGAIHWEEL